MGVEGVSRSLRRLFFIGVHNAPPNCFFFRFLHTTGYDHSLFPRIFLATDLGGGTGKDADPNQVEYSFKLPNTTDWFDNGIIENNADIALENVNFKENIYSWDLNRTTDIKSAVESLLIKANQNEPTTSTTLDGAGIPYNLLYIMS